MLASGTSLCVCRATVLNGSKSTRRIATRSLMVSSPFYKIFRLIRGHSPGTDCMSFTMTLTSSSSSNVLDWHLVLTSANESAQLNCPSVRVSNLLWRLMKPVYFAQTTINCIFWIWKWHCNRQWLLNLVWTMVSCRSVVRSRAKLQYYRVVVELSLIHIWRCRRRG